MNTIGHILCLHKPGVVAFFETKWVKLLLQVIVRKSAGLG